MSIDYKKRINESPLLDKSKYNEDDFEFIKLEKEKIIIAYHYLCMKNKKTDSNYEDMCSDKVLFLITNLDKLLEKYTVTRGASFLTYINSCAERVALKKLNISGVKQNKNLVQSINSYCKQQDKSSSKLDDDDIDYLVRVNKSTKKTIVSAIQSMHVTDIDKKNDEDGLAIIDFLESNECNLDENLVREENFLSFLSKIENYYTQKLAVQGRKNFVKHISIWLITKKNIDILRFENFSHRFSFWDKKIITTENASKTQKDLCKELGTHSSKCSNIMDKTREYLSRATTN